MCTIYFCVDGSNIIIVEIISFKCVYFMSISIMLLLNFEYVYYIYCSIMFIVFIYELYHNITITSDLFCNVIQ